MTDERGEPKPKQKRLQKNQNNELKTTIEPRGTAEPSAKICSSFVPLLLWNINPSSVFFLPFDSHENANPAIVARSQKCELFYKYVENIFLITSVK